MLKNVAVATALILPLVFPAHAKYKSPTGDLREMAQQLSERVADLEKYKATNPPYVISGTRALGVKLSGQVNRAVLWAHRDNNDDGNDFNDSEFFNVDNDNASTRFNISGYSGLGPQGSFFGDMSAGTHLSVEMLANSTADINFNAKASINSGFSDFAKSKMAQPMKRTVGSGIRLRKAELYLDKEDHGRIWAGFGNMATDGVTEVDLSGTDVVAYSGTQDFAGGLRFDNDLRVRDVFTNLDGFRDVRFQYVSERFNGFEIQADFAEDSDYSAAVYYSAQHDGYKLAGGFGYTHWRSAEDHKDLFSGSISALCSNGVSFTFAAGYGDDDSFEDDGQQAEIWTAYAKLGYQYDYHAFSLDVGYTDKEIDDQSSGFDLEGLTVGLAAVHNIPTWATQLYAGARWYGVDVDRNTGDDDFDIFGVMVGSRIKF